MNPSEAAVFCGRVSSLEQRTYLASSFNDRFHFIEIMLEGRNEERLRIWESPLRSIWSLFSTILIADDVDVGPNVVPRTIS